MSLTIDPLHSKFAAEIGGVDLTTSVSDDDFAAIRDAIDTHSVLVFRGQDISDAQQVAFSERFGKLEQMLIGSMGGGTPIADLSNVDPETDEIIPPDDKRMVRNACNMLWHTDSSFKKVPSKFSILSGREVPETDGPTEFASMRAAYEALDASTKERIEDLVAIHSFAYSRSLVEDSMLSQEQKDEVPPVKQVLVRRNPDNGRKSLYLGSHAAHIIGMPVAEGRALLRDLLEQATKAQFIYRHEWRPKDLVIWDNRAVLHRARPWDFEQGRRVMHRTTVAGDCPTLEEPKVPSQN